METPSLLILHAIPLARNWYQAGYRPYHNFYHASRVLRECESFFDRFDRDEYVKKYDLFLAALYHDAVYIPGYESNEKLSTLALENDMKFIESSGVKVDWDIVQDAKELILHTTIEDHLYRGRLGESDLAILLDVDLISLSDPYDVFLDTQKNILKENFLDPEKHENLKRSSDFLNKFITSRLHIYHTEQFQEEHEHRARSNIIRFSQEVS